jgi:hypothetical protein
VLFGKFLQVLGFGRRVEEPSKDGEHLTDEEREALSKSVERGMHRGFLRGIGRSLP